MALNKRERNLLIITIAAVVVGLNWLLVAPLFGKWQTFRAQLASKRKELQGMQATVAHKAEWKADYDQLGKSLQSSVTFDAPSDVLKKIKLVAVAYSFVDRELFPNEEAYKAEAEVEERAGEVIEQGRTGDVIAAPRHEYTRELLAAVPRLDV